MLPPTLKRFRSRPMLMFVPDERDPVEHVERVHVATGRDRRTGQNRVERDPVDCRRAAGDQRTGEIGVLESLDVTNLTGVDGDLADIENVAPIRRPVGEALREALLLLLARAD